MSCQQRDKLGPGCLAQQQGMYSSALWHDMSWSCTASSATTIRDSGQLLTTLNKKPSISQLLDKNLKIWLVTCLLLIWRIFKCKISIPFASKMPLFWSPLQWSRIQTTCQIGSPFLEIPILTVSIPIFCCWVNHQFSVPSKTSDRTLQWADLFPKGCDLSLGYPDPFQTYIKWPVQ